MNSIISEKNQREKFSIEEDEKLTELVNQFGAKNWNFIASHIQTKSGSQCRGRWMRYLSPSISKKSWTEEEDVKLIELFMNLGSKWSLISQHFKGRSDLSVRNRFSILLNQEVKKLKNSDHCF
jgi:hypothetical protein